MLAELADLPATWADMAGFELDYTQFGKSLLGAVAGNPIHKDAVFCEGGRIHGEIQAMEGGHGPKSPYWPRLSTQSQEGPEHTKAIMIRMNQYKYVMRLYEQDEFYDLENDPMELVNRIDEPQYQSQIQTMRMRLLQFYIECLDPIKETPGAQEYSLTPKRYEVFLKSLFDAWYLDVKAGKPVYNRYFDNLLMILDRQIPESCNMRGICANQWVIEADGSTYPCDFYALDQWLLGNIREDSFEKMDLQREQSGFIQFSQQIHRDCRSCSWLPLCRGGCRRNREPVTCNSTEKNYFCSAYQGFFEYAYPRLQEVYQNLKIHSDFSNFQ